MLLAVDARNRSVAVGFREGEAWLARRRFGVSAERSSDEYAWFFAAAFAEARAAAKGAGPRVERAIIASVVPALTPRLVEAVERAFGLEPLLVGPGLRSGVMVRSELPQEVGADLVCEAAAARLLCPGRPCVVADFGGALTFSAIGPAGEFLGAAIAPGLEAAALSLHAGSALLPEVRAEAPPRAIGRTTFASIQSGLHFGYQGLVGRLVALFRAELSSPDFPAAGIELIATGDEAGRALVEGLEPARFVGELALEGLAAIAARAAAT